MQYLKVLQWVYNYIHSCSPVCRSCTNAVYLVSFFHGQNNSFCGKLFSLFSIFMKIFEHELFFSSVNEDVCIWKHAICLTVTFIFITMW